MSTLAEKQLGRLEAHCPTCEGERSCDVHVRVDQPWEDSGVYGAQEYRLLECRGCRLVFYHQSSWFSENCEDVIDPQTGEHHEAPIVKIITYPAARNARKSEKPMWFWDLREIDLQLWMIMGETYKAYEADSYILASVGLRTAFDRTTEHLGIASSDSLADKVKALHQKGYIGETEKMTLSVVIDAGSAAAHRGWAPSEGEFRILLATLEQFIERAVVNGKKALDIAAKIPSKPPRAVKPTD